jgi:hypothetical protein
MSLLSTTANVSAVAPNRSLTTLLQYNFSALECRFLSARVIQVAAATDVPVPLEGISRLKVLALQTKPATTAGPIPNVDVSISPTTTRTYTGVPGPFHLRTWNNPGLTVLEVWLRSPTPALVEVCLAGD